MEQQITLHSLNLDVGTEDLERLKRCAAYSGQELSAWAKSVLSHESDRVLSVTEKVEPTFEIPSWAVGLSVRTVKVLVSAGVNSKEHLIKWFNENSATDIKGYPNSGNYVYNELCMWMNA